MKKFIFAILALTFIILISGCVQQTQVNKEIKSIGVCSPGDIFVLYAKETCEESTENLGLEGCTFLNLTPFAGQCDVGFGDHTTFTCEFSCPSEKPVDSKTCTEAVEDLEALVGNSNSCQADSDCVFTEPSFIIIDGIAYNSDYKYAVDKVYLEEINSKIKNIAETSCKDAPSNFWGPLDYTKCKDNKCIAGKITANQQAALWDKCCTACLYGAGHDPRGFDISIAPCLDYRDENRYDDKGSQTEEKILSQECVDYFEKNSANVGDCR